MFKLDLFMVSKNSFWLVRLSTKFLICDLLKNFSFKKRKTTSQLSKKICTKKKYKTFVKK